eukprot:12192198-Prorocentrum_lima.AAC.1
MMCSSCGTGLPRTRRFSFLSSVQFSYAAIGKAGAGSALHPSNAPKRGKEARRSLVRAVDQGWVQTEQPQMLR